MNLLILTVCTVVQFLFISFCLTHVLFCYRSKKELDQEEYMFFLTGGVGLENKLSNPAPTWLTDKSWDELCRLSDLKSYKKLRYEYKYIFN